MPSWKAAKCASSVGFCGPSKKRCVQSPEDPGSHRSMGMGMDVNAMSVACVIAVCFVPIISPSGQRKLQKLTSWA